MSGFTLLELLIAVALMAFVALLGWRGLESVISARDDITRHSDRLRALANAFGQIEDDLRSAWFTRLMVTRDPVILLRKDDAAGFALELLRPAPWPVVQAAPLPERESLESISPQSQAVPPPAAQSRSAPAMLQKVVWRIRGGLLERGMVPWRPGAGELSAVGWVWQTVVTGLDAGQWRIWVDNSGWLAESPPPLASGATPKEGEPAPQPALAVPGGLELALTIGGERIVRVLSARD
jgi:prepilin-type N-terminal cleavage/methylation domain-containing protein